MIDAHCHLYSDKYDNDLDEVIQRARKSLEAVVISAVDTDTLRKSLSIRRHHPDFIHVTAGIHPRNAARMSKEEVAHLWKTIRSVKGRIVAIGEVGPDFHHIKDSRQRQRQLMVLEKAMEQAEAISLPLVIHARQAEEAALEVVSQSRTPVLFHCYAGTGQTAKRISNLGFYLSFSAVLLFDPLLQKTATELPLELMLTETDSPALSPRRQQRRNEPAFLEVIVHRLAKLLNYPSDEIASITAANARRFYRLPANAGA